MTCFRSARGSVSIGAFRLGLEPVGTYHKLVRHLQEHIESLSGVDGLRPVLLLDESHDMRPEVLAILRILTNFEMDSRLVLAVVLAGQAGLSRLLERPDLAAVRSRLAHVATLRLLSRSESADYVAHRLTVAGAKNDPFDAAALDAVFEIAPGNLRYRPPVPQSDGARCLAGHRDRRRQPRRHRQEAPPALVATPEMSLQLERSETAVVLEYLEHHLPGWPFDPDIDRPFVDELHDDFPHIYVLE